MLSHLKSVLMLQLALYQAVAAMLQIALYQAVELEGKKYSGAILDSILELCDLHPSLLITKFPFRSIVIYNLFS